VGLIKNMNVRVQAKGHANLDSFPFRFGFYFNKDSTIELTNVKNRGSLSNDNRYPVDANFINPKNNKLEKGRFILLADKENTIITVWRLGGESKTEMLLSETLRIAREKGDIDSDDMITMYNKKVRGHYDLIKYLSEKLSAEEVVKIEEDTDARVERISHALAKLAAENDELKQQNIKHPEGITNSLNGRFKILSVEVVSGMSLHPPKKWSGDMQRVTTDYGVGIDNLPNISYGRETPGYDWSHHIGGEPMYGIRISPSDADYPWIKKGY
jgi:hypothetical protein